MWLYHSVYLEGTLWVLFGQHKGSFSVTLEKGCTWELGVSVSQDKVAGRFSSDLDNLINPDNSDVGFTAFKCTSQLISSSFHFLPKCLGLHGEKAADIY